MYMHVLHMCWMFGTYPQNKSSTCSLLRVNGINLGSQVCLGGDSKADGRRICITLAAEGKRLTTHSVTTGDGWIWQ
jgi:hypothetical protein